MLRESERSIVENGYDVPPPFSPGCTTARSHLHEARILLICSPTKTAQATSCAERLAAEGFEVSQCSLHSVSRERLNGVACAAFLPDVGDAAIAFYWVDAVRGTAQPPWVVVCNVDPNAVEARVQIAGTDSAEPLFEVIVAAVRSWHGQLARSPYDIFLSYRRKDVAIAKTINRFMTSWWDRAVLRPGVDWASEIESVLVAADCSPSYSEEKYQRTVTSCGSSS
jgi:hypothetical protein